MNYKVIGFTNGIDYPIIINPETGLVHLPHANWKWMQSFAEGIDFEFNHNLPYSFGKSGRELFTDSVRHAPLALWEKLLPEFLSESIKDDDISWVEPEEVQHRALVAQFYNSDLSWEQALNQVKEAA